MNSYTKNLGPTEHLIRQYEQGSEKRWVNLAKRAFKGRTIPSWDDHIARHPHDANLFTEGEVQEVNGLIENINKYKKSKDIDIAELKNTLKALKELLNSR